ncbi:MAG: arginine--tRNA ligase, partial [Bacteroidales bacterium]|nr:arginine--tRNA ligase [Bacteroidales bacterium]
MNPEIFISNIAKDAVKALYGVEADDKLIQTQATRKEFEGDITLVALPLLKMSRKSPEATGTEVGEYIKANEKYVENYNVVKGFLNIKLSEEFWKNTFSEICAAENYGQLPATG